VSVSSLEFLVFVAAVWAAHALAPERFRWVVLLAASAGFYATWHAPHLLGLLAASTLAAWGAGRALARATGPRRSALLWAGIAAQVALLASAKYGPPVLFALGAIGPDTVLATLGLSYFTLQAIAYVAGVYLEVDAPEPHLGRFALYLAFFPKLLQGPIERPGDLLPQLRAPYRFDYQAVRSGLALVGWGLFKKLVVASRFGAFVDPAFAAVRECPPKLLLLATYLYAFQIYVDFSAYTDIARGTARLFGIELSRNFDSPYGAPSVAEFWRRWHMSFSRWLLEHVFQPLQWQWRSLKTLGTVLALLVTFLGSGLWHGVGWTFVAWGALHGVYLAAGTLWRPVQKRIDRAAGRLVPVLRAWRVLVTFHLVCLAWIFFRANTVSDALFVIQSIAGSAREAWAELPVIVNGALWNFEDRVLMVALPLVLLEGRLAALRPLERAAWLRWPAYAALFLTVLFLGNHGENTFIYSRF
jgi:D-alanyl-lipoteichoic acid acyltransferase DltB (MBOAT superfamily)